MVIAKPMQLRGLRQRRRDAARPMTASQGIIPTRFFHATRQQPIWYIGVGLAGVGLYMGTRYVLRAQERMRRRREGLPEEDDEDDHSDGEYTGDAPSRSRRRIDRILGLDFGSSSLRLATASPYSSGRTRVLENAEGIRAIPAAVAVDNGIVLVGTLAKALQGRKPGCTGTATRLLLGKTPQQVAGDAFFQGLPFSIETEGDRVELVLDGKAYSTEWAAEVMLDHLHDMAARSLGDEARDGFPAVLAVPAGAQGEQRSAFERIAVTAGFDLVSSVEEPIAALHAVERSVADEATAEEFLGAFSGRSSGPIAVFDMGGYVSTVSLLERTQNKYAVLASASTTAISGSHVDKLLFRRVVDKFYQEVGIDLSIDHMASYRILEAVEAAKIELSSRKTTDLNLPFVTADHTGAKHLVQKLSTYDLSRVLEAPVQDALALCTSVLKQAGLRREDVGLLVLIGGGVRTATVRTELERFFRLRAFESKDFRPEEAVVVGATEFGRRLVADEAD